MKYYINPTGKFVIGGPHGDSGVTGRKIIVDTYGGMGRHGGGAFSGKDPTKVDRSAAYMARYVAKNVVASGLAERCEIQLAYAIGVSEPVSVHVDTQGTGQAPDALIAELVRRHFPLTPSGIIKHLDLRRPIYRKTASGGHFGRSEPEFTWEKTDKADPAPRRRQRHDRRDGHGLIGAEGDSLVCRVFRRGCPGSVRAGTGSGSDGTSPSHGHRTRFRRKAGPRRGKCSHASPVGSPVGPSPMRRSRTGSTASRP